MTLKPGVRPDLERYHFFGPARRGRCIWVVLQGNLFEEEVEMKIDPKRQEPLLIWSGWLCGRCSSSFQIDMRADGERVVQVDLEI